MNAGYKADETCYLCRKESQTFKHFLFECEKTAELPNLLKIFTIKDLFTTSMTDQSASIVYVTTIIFNSWKEDSKPVQNMRKRLIRRMTTNDAMVDSCSQRKQVGEVGTR